ncbi:aconitase/3-isopropylmalate dehydratase large subunit family protein [Nocardia aurantiaca]|uniref:3-isopropylmalate dehydratase/homoaconitate hydratase family large subunit n=1 Tax=Nocardia aurantiaca TaxID=2675850 RepID=A0A6I3L8Q7_9NOCA|nr:aconitase/3-isopropylmalate dehydratase large subunit family protein [Nocardia aurantiaca]MTE16815.1 3-isopropylmalate dehydratase/homoaconitate hydratase family large subunit [Nocardia aurantiaca]
MPDTLIARILRARSGGDPVGVGDIVVCDVDLAVLIDLQFGNDRLEDVVAIHDPDKVAIVMDHVVPAQSVRDAELGARARAFAATHKIANFFDIGKHGIVHQVLAEQGLARPGMVIACTDSHTCAAGAVAAAARGLGPAEVLQIVCTGRTWHRVPPTIRYELHGRKHEWVNGKDIFLAIAGQYGDATDHAVEFGGPGLTSLPMTDRRTIATQGAEIGADFTLFPADQVCLDYVRAAAPDSEPQLLDADPGAEYAAVHVLDLDRVSPMVALPGHVINNAGPVENVVGTKVDQAFIGSCANGQLADIEIAARILKNRRVAPQTRLIVTPASQQIYSQASRLGYLADLADAGATITNPTCGACFGYHMGVVAAGETCITASTRNFRGRMGSPEANIYMASPATVAASALRGAIADVRDLDGVSA